MADTITALATAPGISGLAVIRVSGNEAFEICAKIFRGKSDPESAISHTIRYGEIRFEGELIDKVTASVFVEPNSYTGENVVEIGCHGGRFVVSRIIDALLKSGARLAEPGEFTKRAFLNGKLDLTQSEAVADLIHSESNVGVQTAARQLAGGFKKRLSGFREKLVELSGLLELELDFAEEDIEFVDKSGLIETIGEVRGYCDELADSFAAAEIYRSGYFLGIAGFPNSGKSTLFNALLAQRRAIVSEVPGTTRDYIEGRVFFGGVPTNLIDTAGLRETEDAVEIEGIKFVEELLEQCNTVLLLNDASLGFDRSDELAGELAAKYPATVFKIVQNKIDLLDSEEIETARPNDIFISAKKGDGLDELKSYIENEILADANAERDALVNERQATLLRRASNNLYSAVDAFEAGFDNEIAAAEVRRACDALGEITGEIRAEETLNAIFSKFCIGK